MNLGTRYAKTEKHGCICKLYKATALTVDLDYRNVHFSSYCNYFWAWLKAGSKICLFYDICHKVHINLKVKHFKTIHCETNL